MRLKQIIFTFKICVRYFLDFGFNRVKWKQQTRENSSPCFYGQAAAHMKGNLRDFKGTLFATNDCYSNKN